jgi:branched-chain amino acid transport system permease protein
MSAGRLQGGSAPLRILPGAFRRAVERFAGRHQSLAVLVGVALVGAFLPVIIGVPPFSGFGNRNDFVDGFANAGVFVLLALGLNVVVGLAGLLDLGYAAFFAIGS